MNLILHTASNEDPNGPLEKTTVEVSDEVAEQASFMTSWLKLAALFREEIPTGHHLVRIDR